MTFGPASLLGVEPYESTAPQQNYQAGSSEEQDSLLRAAYRQVLGNSYVMDSERQIVTESQFKMGRISMREFVRALAKSSLYRSRFFDACNRYRYIELTFKHLLGRSPDSFEEMRQHAHRLDRQGYDADIDSFINSDEYQERFGEDTVPYLHGWKSGPGKSMRGFTWMFQLTRGAASSDLKGDLSGIEFKLGSAAYINRSLPIIAPSGINGNGQGFGFRPTPLGRAVQTRLGVGATDEGKVFRVETTGYLNYSKHRKSNKVLYLPFNKLLEQLQRIRSEGGKVSSITPVP